MIHVCFICFKNSLHRLPQSGYEDILNYLNFKSINDRRKLDNKIDDSFLLSNITLRTNKHNIQNRELFYINHYSKTILCPVHL